MGRNRAIVVLREGQQKANRQAKAQRLTLVFTDVVNLILVH